MAIEHYVDISGIYLGQFDGITPPTGSIMVPTGPFDTREIWNFTLNVWEDLGIPKDYRIYETYLNFTGDAALWPGNFDFKTQSDGRLFPKHAFDILGELESTTYFIDFDGVNHTNPAFIENYTYPTDKIVVTTEFFFDDGTLSLETKVQERFTPEDPPVIALRDNGGTASNVIKNLAPPQTSDEAASKGYADGLFSAFFESFLSGVFFVPFGEMLSIQVNKQSINKGGMDIEGDIENDGQLFLER